SRGITLGPQQSHHLAKSKDSGRITLLRQGGAFNDFAQMTIEFFCIGQSIDHKSGQSFRSIERNISSSLQGPRQIKAPGAQLLGQVFTMRAGSDHDRDVSTDQSSADESAQLVEQ